MAGKSKSWTPERRAKHAQWMRENRPWERSTGPKSTAGKKSVKYNALKHGFRSKEVQDLRRLLRLIQEKTS